MLYKLHSMESSRSSSSHPRPTPLTGFRGEVTGGGLGGRGRKAVGRPLPQPFPQTLLQVSHSTSVAMVSVS